MEAVEARILFSSAPWWQSADAAVGTLKDLQGNVMGSASLDNGLLTVNGTSAGEEIVLGMAFGDPTNAYVRITRCTNPDKCEYVSATFVYDRAQLTGIVVNAGDGDDSLNFLSFGKALSLRVTLNGDAGDDGFEGNGDAWDENRNDYVVDTTYVGVVMHGGEGNDTLLSGYGPDLLDGGNGDDVIGVNVADMATKTIVYGSGHDTLHLVTPTGDSDSPLTPPSPPTALPAVIQPHPDIQSKPVATPAPATLLAPPVKVAAPAAFAMNPLLTSEDKLWDA